MKKLTEKDAIWCNKKESVKIFELHPEWNNSKNVKIPLVIVKNKEISKSYFKDVGFTIHKAKDILNSSKKVGRKFYAKELEILLNDEDLTDEKLREASEGLLPNICDYLNNVGVFGNKFKKNAVMLHNSHIFNPIKFDLPTKELEELPQKWCIKVNVDNFKELQKWTRNIELNYDVYILSDAKTFYSLIKPSDYTEITFDQFKKWVLKEEEKPLSIREVQVKVSSQEEANECAEIAKACGEEIGDIQYEKKINYFRKDSISDEFQTIDFSLSYNEISIQEYRERFGKKQETEIDWSKAGQLVESEWNVVMTLGNYELMHKYCFYGVAVVDKKPKENNNNPAGDISSAWTKDKFKLCTEPITLKN